MGELGEPISRLCADVRRAARRRAWMAASLARSCAAIASTAARYATLYPTFLSWPASSTALTCTIPNSKSPPDGSSPRARAAALAEKSVR